jgi:hypothetical protein
MSNKNLQTTAGKPLIHFLQPVLLRTHWPHTSHNATIFERQNSTKHTDVYPILQKTTNTPSHENFGSNKYYQKENSKHCPRKQQKWRTLSSLHTSPLSQGGPCHPRCPVFFRIVMRFLPLRTWQSALSIAHSHHVHLSGHNYRSILTVL